MKFYVKDGKPNFEKLKEVKKLSDEFGCTQAQLAILWVVMNRDTSVCLLGASKIS